MGLMLSSNVLQKVMLAAADITTKKKNAGDTENEKMMRGSEKEGKV